VTNLVAYSTASAPPNIYEQANIWFDISQSVVSGSYGLTWGQDVCKANSYTFITDTYTQSLAGGTINDSTPIFYITTTTSSTDTLAIINRLPDVINQQTFTDVDSALNWISNSGKYITLLDCNIYTSSVSFLLQENGSYLLQENGDKIILTF
jgi:hypothetical protein